VVAAVYLMVEMRQHSTVVLAVAVLLVQEIQIHQQTLEVMAALEVLKAV
jgi:hypothetical protein